MPIEDYSYTPAANTSISGIAIGENCAAANINNAMRQMMSDTLQEIAYQGADISASASISLAGVGWRFMAVTGSASIISVGTGRAGLHRELLWNSPSTVVASANILTDGAANIVTATNDVSIMISKGSGIWRMLHFPAAGVNIPDGSITTAKLANGAATFVKMQAITDGRLLGASGSTAISEISLGSGLTLAAGVLTASSSVTRYRGTYSTNADLTTQLPADDTVPTNSEGTQIISIGSVVVATGQRVAITFSGQASYSFTNNTLCISLIRGTTCIFAKAARLQGDNSGNLTLLPLDFFFDEAPAAGTYTYSVRVGPDAADTIRLNGTDTGRYFGGVSVAYAEIEVYT